MNSKRCRESVACQEATTKIEGGGTGARCTTKYYCVEQRREKHGLHFRCEVRTVKGKKRSEVQDGIGGGAGARRSYEGEEVVVHVARSMSTEACSLRIAEQREFGNVGHQYQAEIANFGGKVVAFPFSALQPVR
jgi:hypothetical protein